MKERGEEKEEKERIGREGGRERKGGRGREKTIFMLNKL